MFRSMTVIYSCVQYFLLEHLWQILSYLFYIGLILFCDSGFLQDILFGLYYFGVYSATTYLDIQSFYRDFDPHTMNIFPVREKRQCCSMRCRIPYTSKTYITYELTFHNLLTFYLKYHHHTLSTASDRKRIIDWRIQVKHISREQLTSTLPKYKLMLLLIFWSSNWLRIEWAGLDNPKGVYWNHYLFKPNIHIYIYNQYHHHFINNAITTYCYTHL